MIDISRAVKIDGWMSETELKWLAVQASTHEFIVEIGPYLGRSTRAMADNTKAKIIAVDTWKGPIGLNEREELPCFLTKFAENLAEHIESGRVCPVSSDKVSPGCTNIDFVFIDGDHKYEAVKKDLLFWKERIKSGGLIAGHDSDCIEVARAVGEVLACPQFVENTRIWFSVV